MKLDKSVDRLGNYDNSENLSKEKKKSSNKWKKGSKK